MLNRLHSYMCGIVGFSGKFDQELLSAMNDSQLHRGPDSNGSWFCNENHIGLGHQRLSILDLSTNASQPMFSADKSVVIIFNGEIYNFLEHREKLLSEGVSFISNSDTEVLLNLYLRDGYDMLQHLNGMYAFAIWDSRNTSLFIARDQVGVKPLYYTNTPKGFLFASELKALLQEGTVSRKIDVKAVSHYLTYLWSPGERTILEGVKKLEPGEALIVERGKIVKHWSHYKLPYKANIEKISSKEAIPKVEKQLRKSVKSQLVSDVPIGAFLSGGLDSSSVVALAKAESQETNIECFTIRFNDKKLQREGMAEDLPYAQKVAKHLDVNLHTVDVDSSIIDDLQKMIYHLDEPLADPAPLNALYISELARKNGIKVLLSGAGGDDVFTGYRRHFALKQERYWSWFPKYIRSSMRVITGLGNKQSPTMRRVAKAFQYADLPEDERLVSYFYWMKPSLTKNIFAKEHHGILLNYDISEPMKETLSIIEPGVDRLNQMLSLEKKHFLADHNLNYTDKMGMAFGVEARVPLLDPDLIDLVAKLPPDMKQNGKHGKWIFKKAMEPYLPKDVIYRPKTGFGAPLRYWLNNELKEVVDDVLSDSSIINRGLFDPKAVAQLIQYDRSGSMDLTYPIFALICIELWCRIFIDNTVPKY